MGFGEIPLSFVPRHLDAGSRLPLIPAVTSELLGTHRMHAVAELQGNDRQIASPLERALSDGKKKEIMYFIPFIPHLSEAIALRRLLGNKAMCVYWSVFNY